MGSPHEQPQSFGGADARPKSPLSPEIHGQIVGVSRNGTTISLREANGYYYEVISYLKGNEPLTTIIGLTKAQYEKLLAATDAEIPPSLGQLKENENEAKFLLNALPDLSQAQVSIIAQDYLVFAEDFTEVRIRQKGSRFYQTLKRAGDETRPEAEIELSPEQYNALKRLPSEGHVEKQRNVISFEGFTLEVDKYLGDLLGIWILEVETAEKARLEEFRRIKPDWVGPEITFDPRCKIRNLLQRGIPDELKNFPPRG